MRWIKKAGLGPLFAKRAAENSRITDERVSSLHAFTLELNRRTQWAPATQTKLVAPFGVDFDAAGNLYLVEMAGGERVRKMGRDGVLHIIAGTGTKGFAGDNAARCPTATAAPKENRERRGSD